MVRDGIQVDKEAMPPLPIAIIGQLVSADVVREKNSRNRPMRRSRGLVLGHLAQVHSVLSLTQSVSGGE